MTILNTFLAFFINTSPTCLHPRWSAEASLHCLFGWVTCWHQYVFDFEFHLSDISDSKYFEDKAINFAVVTYHFASIDSAVWKRFEIINVTFWYISQFFWPCPILSSLYLPKYCHCLRCVMTPHPKPILINISSVLSPMVGLSPHSQNVLGFDSRSDHFCEEFACSPCACVGSLWVLRLPLVVQKHANSRLD